GPPAGEDEGLLGVGGSDARGQGDGQGDGEGSGKGRRLGPAHRKSLADRRRAQELSTALPVFTSRPKSPFVPCPLDVRELSNRQTACTPSPRRRHEVTPTWSSRSSSRSPRPGVGRLTGRRGLSVPLPIVDAVLPGPRGPEQRLVRQK